MTDEVQFDRALESIYGATLGEGFWPKALQTVAGMFDSDFAHFEVLKKKTGQPVFFENHGASAESLDLYVSYYASVSPRAAAGQAQPEGHVSYDYEMLSEAEIERNEFYADFMQPQGYKYFLSANLINSEDLFSVFSVQRPLGQDHASEDEIALMRRLAPHLSQAMKIHLQLPRMPTAGASHSILFEHSTTGILVIGADGRVQSANPAAERILADPRNPIDIRSNELLLGDDPGAQALSALLARTLATALGTGSASAGAITIPRVGRLPLTAFCVPHPGGHSLAGFTKAPVVTLLICEPGSDTTLSDELLVMLFGLTRAECRTIRAILAGQTAAEYADQAGVGIRTVRTHISRVLSKTGTRSQTELALLLGSIPYEFR